MTSTLKILRYCPLIFALAALVIAAPVRAEEPLGGTERDHDLSKAQVVDRVILAVMEHYYDSSRIDPAGMFDAAMSQLQKSIAEVKVDHDEKSEWATIEVLDEKLKIDVGEIR